MSQKERAVILLSGGLDSLVTLAIAKSYQLDCHALTFDYGQRHIAEIQSAKRIATAFGIKHDMIALPTHLFKNSSLTDQTLKVPTHQTNIPHDNQIPNTYVPGRNMLFLTHAVSLAESMGARFVFIGATAVDYSNYPDCRPEFYEAFNQTISQGTKAGVQGTPMTAIRVHTPLLYLSKQMIIAHGHKLGVDFSLSVSCYQATAEGLACGQCESCLWRKKGFSESGVVDTTRYG
jgi:7-cyano-7-deazaguanine synthase